MISYELKIAMLFFTEKIKNFVDEIETIPSDQKVYKKPNRNSRIEKEPKLRTQLIRLIAC